MIVTVQLADLGVRGAVSSLARRLDLSDVPGLRSAETALLAPLAANRPPPIGRVGLIAFWDDDSAADRFVAGHPVGRRFDGGVRAHLRPLRAYGSWPGLPDDVPTGRAIVHEGPVVVLTLARIRASQTIRFARTSRPAEKAATEHEGMIWGTAAARLPFLATISIWVDAQAAAGYAYGKQRPAHHDAIERQRVKDFHRESAFIRFAPTRITGAIHGSNPFDAADMER